MTLRDDRANVPDEPPVLLPGRSANHWYRVAAVLLFAGAGCAAIGVTILAIGGRAALPLVEGVFGIGIVIGISLAIVGVPAARAQLREERHGYTTLYLKSRRRYWQLDPKTGEVLRRPGEAKARARGQPPAR